MNDLVEKKAKIWNGKLRKCLNAGNYTQESFAEELNNEYGTTYSQKAVSRWINVGAKQRRRTVGFPKYETMLRIAGLLNVDIGYLTGETDNSSFTMEKACSFMGLNQTAIEAIRDVTCQEGKNDSPLRQVFSEGLNAFLSSDRTQDLFHALIDLYISSLSLYESKKRVYPPLGNEEDNELRLENIIDEQYGLSEQTKYERFIASEAFILLIDDVF